MPSPTQVRGTAAEDRAAAHLESAGLRIVGRNLRCRCGELDLIAVHADVLVIAEVRLRSSAGFGGAAASIGWLKRRRILCATQYFLKRNPAWQRLRIRFDALLLDDSGTVTWLRHAFDCS
jgi:putative endonuclease